MDKQYIPAMFCFFVTAVAVVISVHHNWQKQRKSYSKQAVYLKVNGGVR